MNDLRRATEVCQSVLKIIPHKLFTFGKIWIFSAQLEIRKRNINKARTLFRDALNLCPKNKIFRYYNAIEFYMGELSRCRKIYEKFIEFCPSNSEAWIKFAEFEALVMERKRATAIYELAIKQPILDMPESLWKSYIDFERRNFHRKRARKLFERLLDKTNHIRVWLDYALFEYQPLNHGRIISLYDQSKKNETAVIRENKARDIYERAYHSLRDNLSDHKEATVILLESWYDFEKNCVQDTQIKLTDRLKKIQEKMPRKVKRKRMIYNENGTEAGDEEY